ncbi:MAG: thioredoxin family protein, partial [Kiritimatiellae bacterium]|nr:thioredoxin family protein [Kiritimatiellia bacterium]
MKKSLFALAAAMLFCGALRAETEETVENDPDEKVKFHYEGILPVREGESAVVFTNIAVSTLAGCSFKATMCGAWVNEGKPKVVRGYNKDYREGESLSIQFQCSDYSISDRKGYVKCVRVVFTDSPEGVRAVCDYSGYVTLGYQGNAVGYKFNDPANWKAVDTPDGKGYGIQSFTAFPLREFVRATSTPKGFTDDLDAALEQAKKENKKILAVFSASDLSVRCQEFTTNVLENAAFLAATEANYVRLFIDNPEDPALITD